jgi:hypothetical protein
MNGRKRYKGRERKMVEGAVQQFNFIPIQSSVYKAACCIPSN